jgi:hypothetical protein
LPSITATTELVVPRSMPMIFSPCLVAIARHPFQLRNMPVRKKPAVFAASCLRPAPPNSAASPPSP